MSIETRNRDQSAPTDQTSALTGTFALVRLGLRRDRVRLPAWLLGVVALTTISAVSVPEVYPTAEDLQERGDFVSSPVLTMFTGPGYGTDDYTVGAMVANEYLIYGLIAVALMSILLVVRHTRAEEESGRAELVRAAVVGSHAAPTAALLITVGINLVIGVSTALALTISLQELSATGSLVFGMSMTATGIVFAAVAAITAQITEHSRGSTSLAVAALIGAFVLRAVGDMGDTRALSWASPIGWAQSTRAYVDERWWPLVLSVSSAALLTAAAFAVASRRDLAAGLVPPRPGRPTATRWLVRPSGLALRLQWTQLAAWATGVFLLGAAFGSLLGEVENLLADNEQLQEAFGADDETTIIEAYLNTVMQILGLLVAAAALTAALQLRREEEAGHTEPLLATSLSRTRWAGSHIVVSLGGATAIMLLAAAGVGAGAAYQQDDISWLVELIEGGLARLPGIWLIIGAAVALHGLSPRGAPWAWGVVAYAAVVGLLGDAFDLPDHVRALSPFHHLPDLPGGNVNLTSVVMVSTTAAALVAIGLARLSRRDISTP